MRYPDKKSINILFSNCTDRLKKIQFIDKTIQSIKSNSLRNVGNQLTNFLYMVVMHDDLELIKYFFKQINGYQLNLGGDLECLHMFNPTIYIGSVDVLNYLFENHREYFIDDNHNYYSYFENLKLLKHFEGLTLKVPSTPRICEYLQHYTRGDNFQNYISHITRNRLYLSTDLIESVFCFFPDKGLFPINSFQSTTINFKTYKLLANIVFSRRKFRVKKFWPDHFTKDFLNFLDWMFINYPNKMKKGERFFDWDEQLQLFLFLTNRLNIGDISDYKELRFILSSIRLSPNISHLLDLVLKNVKNNEIFLDSLRTAVLDSRLHILEFVNENRGNLLKEIKNLGDQFDSFLNQVLAGDNVRVSEFLLQFTNQADSENLFGPKSLLYISNKLKSLNK
ncbi:hypothetical protein ACTFIW_012402 [Dictyostelium discoideum]